ncbi:MAG: glycoside hydrolase family 28 protein [Rikenellaceae bacterium]|nr:glycoside hydrolase family 28 protein [Rikenellaceae bacterium]
MKKLLLLMMILLSAHLTGHAEGYAHYYRDLAVELPVPERAEIPDREVCITDFGGVGDGVTLNTEPFRKAIAALEKQGGGRLVVPEGVWMVGLISLKDNIELHLERNAILMATPDRSQFFKTDSQGVRDKKPSPMISASKRKNIALTGEGVIDGNGIQWRPVKRGKVSDTEWQEFKAMGGTEAEEGSLWYPFDLKHYPNVAESYAEQEKMRPHLIRFTDCERVLVEGVTLQNAPKFHLIPTRCREVIIDGVKVRCPWNAQNGDAIDISSCRNVLIVNNTIDAGDDGICMKAGAGEAGEKYGPCENILIRDNIVYHAHGGFVIGSEFSGGMKNIVVCHNRFSNTDTGLRFKSGIGRGGRCEGIYISDIMMSDIKDEAIVFECTYQDRAVGKKIEEQEFTEAQLRYAPDFSDIHISRVVCHRARTAIAAHGIPGLRCIHDIRIEGCTFVYLEEAKELGEGVELEISECRFIPYGAQETE